jgi:UDP-N-acetylglucosamine/UDP-N-acetylgalactosamine diphosphorylase
MTDTKSIPEPLYTLLLELGQQAFLDRFEKLDFIQQQQIISQLQKLDPEVLKIQRDLVLTPQETSNIHAKPYDQVIQSGDRARKELGYKAIAEGKVGCIIVAGGQATRMGLEGPKGLVPISNIREKSLFQLFFEKCAAAGILAGRPLPLAVMTSPLNNEETVNFLRKNQYFGLSAEQVDFFQQSMLPFLDEKGHLFLESTSSIAQGPDGNGSSLKSFVDAGIASKWRKQGVDFVIYILIDNPLADPFDAELVGLLAQSHSDVVIKCTTRRSPTEKVGVIVEINQGVKVIEYSELPTEATSWGDLYANISLFGFRLDFIEKMAKQSMPLHKAFKPSKAVDEPKGIKSAWKFEKFIFDVLDKTKKVSVICYPREECFAPLKNKEGPDSIQQVREALLKRDRQIFREITGRNLSEDPIELSQQFYYPNKELLSKSKDAFAQLGYID